MSHINITSKCHRAFTHKPDAFSRFNQCFF
ncbi:hypothetical protein ACF0H5_015650 [Mactra antiquata]